MRHRTLFFILCMVLVLSFCAGCDEFHNAIFEEENIDIPEEEYEDYRFFLKEVDGPMSDSYILCYEHRDGTIIEIVDFGMENRNFVIVDDRIYYVNGSTLTSIDVTGQDKRTFHNAKCEVEPRGILYHGDGWLYCIGTKMVEIYGDPVAVDGPHAVTGFMKVKIDFSGCAEVDASEVEENAK